MATPIVTTSSNCGTEPLTLQPTRVNIMVAVDAASSNASYWPSIKTSIQTLRDNNPNAAFGMHVFWTDAIDFFAGESNLNGSNNPCKTAHDKVLEPGPHATPELLAFLGDAPPSMMGFSGTGTISLIESLNYYVKNASRFGDPNATNYLIVFTPGYDTCFGSFFTEAVDKLVAFQKVSLELARHNIRVIPVGLLGPDERGPTAPNFNALKTVLDNGGSGLKELPTIDNQQGFISSVVQRTNNCRFVVSSGTAAAPTVNPFQLKLSINNMEVPRDRRQQGGWDVVQGTNTQLEFFGAACDAVRAGNAPQITRTCAQEICGTAVVSAETKPRVVLLLLDGSASRTECTAGALDCLAPSTMAGAPASYWVTVQRAVNAALIAPINDDVAFGMQFFPAKAAEMLNCEVAPAPEFPPAQGSQIQIMKAMLEKLPLGLSPVVGVMESVAAAPGQLADPAVSGAVILLSDGGDNCIEAPQTEIVARLDAATQKLSSFGVKTYPIRFGSAAGQTPQQTEQLTTIAMRGGTALIGATPYIDAKSADDLNAALTAISDRLASCSFALGAVNQAVDKNRTNLYLNGEQIGFDRSATRQAGWGWTDTTQNAIELYGEACQAFKTNRRTRVVVEFGCEPVIVVAPD